MYILFIIPINIFLDIAIFMPAMLRQIDLDMWFISCIYASISLIGPTSMIWGIKILVKEILLCV